MTAPVTAVLTRIEAGVRPVATPVTAILAQYEAGVRSVPDLAARTGLTPDLVRAVTERLVRAGRVKPLAISSACAPIGCRDCASLGCPLSSVA